MLSAVGILAAAAVMARPAAPIAAADAHPARLGRKARRPDPQVVSEKRRPRAEERGHRQEAIRFQITAGSSVSLTGGLMPAMGRGSLASSVRAICP